MGSVLLSLLLVHNKNLTFEFSVDDQPPMIVPLPELDFPILKIGKKYRLRKTQEVLERMKG